eukprot:28542_1
MMSSDLKECVRDMKEKLCLVAKDYWHIEFESKSKSNRDAMNVDYELPDGQIIRIDMERYKAPEIIFQPNFIGMSHEGIHKILWDSIMKCDIDMRFEMAKNIVICSG